MGRGGSESGRQVLPCPLPLKLGALAWAVQTFGPEENLLDKKKWGVSEGRGWSFHPFMQWVLKNLPAECAAWKLLERGQTEESPESHACYLLSQRVTPMYERVEKEDGADPRSRALRKDRWRGETSEHPRLDPAKWGEALLVLLKANARDPILDEAILRSVLAPYQGFPAYPSSQKIWDLSLEELERFFGEEEDPFAFLDEGSKVVEPILIVNEVDLEEKVQELIKEGVKGVPRGNPKPRKFTTPWGESRYERDASVKAYALLRSGGLCQHCGLTASLTNRGTHCLQVHHATPLSEGGPDTIDNTVALCGTCHDEVHRSVKASQIRASLFARYDFLVEYRQDDICLRDVG